jgi:hypothetical protein
MITKLNQRWRDGRASYRPAGETIDTRAFEVAAIPDDTTAKAFVTRHHYSASFPAARFRYGLYRGDELAGVAVFSVQWKHVLEPLFPGLHRDCVELGRFVLLDDVAANGETWFLARCFEGLRSEGLAGVVSFSDPCPRAAADGRTVFPGHVGTIYQAFNARYLGRSKAETKWLLANGTVFESRNATKIRKLEPGWRYAVAALERAGAVPFWTLLNPYSYEDRAAWVDAALCKVARKFRHTGNHRYAWGLTRRTHRHLPESQPYPKLSDSRFQVSGT